MLGSQRFNIINKEETRSMVVVIVIIYFSLLISRFNDWKSFVIFILEKYEPHQ